MTPNHRNSVNYNEQSQIQNIERVDSAAKHIDAGAIWAQISALPLNDCATLEDILFSCCCCNELPPQTQCLKTTECFFSFIVLETRIHT